MGWGKVKKVREVKGGRGLEGLGECRVKKCWRKRYEKWEE